MSFDSVRGNQADAGEGTFGACIQTSPANFQSHWSSAEDAMAASIIRLESQKDELNAEVALLREQARILQAERDEAREALRVLEGIK